MIYKKLIESYNHSQSMNCYGAICYEQGNYQEAEKYYLMAIENKHFNPTIKNLKNLYTKMDNINKYYECLESEDEFDNFDDELIDRIYRITIDDIDDNFVDQYLNDESDPKGILRSYYGIHCQNIKNDLVKAEHYFLSIIGKYDYAYCHLGHLYAQMDDIEKSEMYFLKGINENKHGLYSFNGLIDIYIQKDMHDAIEKLAEENNKNINNEILNGNNILRLIGNMYYGNQKYNYAENYYRMAIEKYDDMESVYHLALMLWMTDINKYYNEIEELVIKVFKSYQIDMIKKIYIYYLSRVFNPINITNKIPNKILECFEDLITKHKEDIDEDILILYIKGLQ